MNSPFLKYSRRWFQNVFGLRCRMATMPPLLTRTVEMANASSTLADVLDIGVNVPKQIELLRGPDAEIARDAAAALGNAGDKSATPALIAVLLDSYKGAHPVVRCAAAIALGKLRDPRGVLPLVAALADAMPEVGEEAALALGEMGLDDAVEPLRFIASDTSGKFSSTVRRCAVRALGKLHSPRAASLLLALAINRDEDPAVRQAAQCIGSV